MKPMDLREFALDALLESDPDRKCERVDAIWHAQAQWLINPSATPVATRASALPGRPVRPRLVPPHQVPMRSVHTPWGRAALLHAICHIEFNAINLGLDAVWRFGNMPEEFYRDWMQVAHEEADHFRMLRTILQDMVIDERACEYGDFDAHDGLWQMCEKTAHDVTARMALVPRTLEARGLDATPMIQDKLLQVPAPDALAVREALNVILRDEIGHVAIGNRWYHWCCQLHQLDPVVHMHRLQQEFEAPALKPPFNVQARKQAGFTDTELEYLGVV
ncbi:MAG: hypothetical protein RLZZ397_1179 [Pseudomonadota bacterium]